jgi:hypothetical protein
MEHARSFALSRSVKVLPSTSNGRFGSLLTVIGGAAIPPMAGAVDVGTANMEEVADGTAEALGVCFVVMVARVVGLAAERAVRTDAVLASGDCAAMIERDASPKTIEAEVEKCIVVERGCKAIPRCPAEDE